MPDEEAVERAEWVDGLRQLATFIEEHPDFTLPTCASVVVLVTEMPPEQARAEMARLARQLGNAEKNTYGDWFEVARKFGPHSLDINAYRQQICERVVVGTETVEVADPNAPKVTITRDKVEWKCPPSILEVAS
jgi:hypothetical protein